MKYLDIAVFTKTRSNADIFTYSAEKKVKIGQVVKVNFAGRNLYGMVLKEIRKPNFKTKKIIEVLKNIPILSEHLIKTAFFISDYYAAPIGSILKTMLPAGFYKKRQASKQLPPKADQPLAETAYSKQQIKNNKFKLTLEQEEVLKIILNSNSKKPFLLFGVTGSGKTEIYIRTIEEALNKGKGAIILVPEIALTPQTIRRFEERFPGQTAVFHSHLKETEKQKNWDQIISGEKRIVIGSRSAIFAPIKNLGVIIIDEEHETSYKQENTPRYDTRAVAEFITKETEAKLILGSATPRIESFYKGKKGEYTLLTLEKRIFQEKMPVVKIIDLKNEPLTKEHTAISFPLEQKISQILEEKRKAIIFLNRRGNSTHVFCEDCGFVFKCSDCDIPLTHHFNTGIRDLICHHCGYRRESFASCPNCKSPSILYQGIGIQKVEQELAELFPSANIIRLDKDSVQKRGSHEEIFNQFSKGDTDILLGTQMIAKGWDIPEVDLVGVISADTALNFPDFRASERTFQLLTQIAGRSGRGKSQGEVLIQTYSPENFAITKAKNHDFLAFYNDEVKEREKFFYPPFSKVIRLIYRNKDQDKASKEASNLYSILEKKLKKQYNFNSINILGPSPAFLSKLNGFYRWQIVVKFREEKDKKAILNEIPDDWQVDIDPVDLI
ncbi:MAG: primosomal protein N' [Patescibacteria group bacterium]|nr:primosomal protein N' [Patescibacteria group bacterium]MCL5093613.1 primosomal protein N' [Patescibacteria group bacterium]